MREIRNVISSTNQAIAAYEKSLEELEQMDIDMKGLEETISRLEQDIELFEECRLFLQKLAEVTREQIASELENVVTLCLQAVFCLLYTSPSPRD